MGTGKRDKPGLPSHSTRGALVSHLSARHPPSFLFPFPFLFLVCVRLPPTHSPPGQVSRHTYIPVRCNPMSMSISMQRMPTGCICVVYVYVYVSDMFVRGPLGQECSTRGSRKGSSALLRSPGSPTYSAVRERERERERNVFFSPGRKPCYAGSLPLTGIRSLVRSDDYMTGAVGACTHTIGAVQGLRAHPYPYP